MAHHIPDVVAYRKTKTYPCPLFPKGKGQTRQGQNDLAEPLRTSQGISVGHGGQCVLYETVWRAHKKNLEKWFWLSRENLGAVTMAQGIECQLCKHVGLSSEPWAPCESQAQPMTPVALRLAGRGLWVSGTLQSASMAEIAPSLTNKLERRKGRPLVPACSCMAVCAVYSPYVHVRLGHPAWFPHVRVWLVCPDPPHPQINE